MQPWKAPGPYGFPPGFFQSQWSIVKDDVIKMVQSFFISGKLLKKMNKTNLCLIPKKKLPHTPGDYKPIALCNSTYKLITKLMATRLKVHLDKIISPMQAAYVPGR